MHEWRYYAMEGPFRGQVRRVTASLEPSPWVASQMSDLSRSRPVFSPIPSEWGTSSADSLVPLRPEGVVGDLRAIS